MAIAAYDTERRVAVLCALMSQTGAPPFNPRDAVRKFAAALKFWGIFQVTGDTYAGQTFRRDFEDLGISYSVSTLSKSDIYDAFEPKLNAGEVELLDDGKLQEQLLTLVVRARKSIISRTIMMIFPTQPRGRSFSLPSGARRCGRGLDEGIGADVFAVSPGKN